MRGSNQGNLTLFVALDVVLVTLVIYDGDGNRIFTIQKKSSIADNQSPTKTPTLKKLQADRIDLYGQIFFPEGSQSKQRDDYLELNYINDTNQEYTQALVEYGNDGTLWASYDYGLMRNSRTTKNGAEYYQYDGRGSVSNLLSKQGIPAASYQYSAYGEPLTASMHPNPYTYNGEAWDSGTGLQYLRARYYNPEHGIFLGRDRLEGELMEPLSQNHYIYAVNDRATQQGAVV